MILVFNTEVINELMEIELRNSDKGFDCDVFYRRDEPRKMLNCTEVHHLFKPNEIAFESDIHGTGTTQNILDREITFVVIREARILHENFSGN